MRIRIEATDLPGDSGCSPPDTAQVGPDARVHVGVQRRDRPAELLDLHPADAATATWTLDCTVTTIATGPGDVRVGAVQAGAVPAVDVRGPYISGRRGDRFIYLSWGFVDETGGFAMFRRAKLMLDGVPAAVLRAAEDTGLLLARLGLTDGCGNPLCAAVRPPLIEWSAPS